MSLSNNIVKVSPIQQKEELLSYFRNKSVEIIDEAHKNNGVNNYKDNAKHLNCGLTESKNKLEQFMHNNYQNSPEKLSTILMLNYTFYISMLEARHSIWEYEYMTFSRRIGELWEPFCKLCWDYSPNSADIYIPPLFSDVKNILVSDIKQYIIDLALPSTQKDQLLKYYTQVWNLVDSGNINLELDLHFRYNEINLCIDFKSGFNSNEKGNLNRLLLVASVYKNLLDSYECILFVRSEDNNNYLEHLRESKLWTVYCGTQVYQKISEYTQFDFSLWLQNNINWKEDFNEDMNKFIINTELDKYLQWI